MKQLTKEQNAQEQQYYFPYHYLGLQLELYRELEHRHYLSVMKICKEMLRPFNGQKILDAGCGDGRFCYEFRNENVEVLGVDYSERAIGFAKAFNPSMQFCVADLTQLDYENHFDIVTLIEVLEHIPPEKIKDCISSLSRALKIGGRLLVSVPTVNLPLHKKHYQHFTMKTLLSIFGDEFNLISKCGHTKSGKAWKRYNSKLKCGYLLWPLRNKLSIVKRYFNHIANYYSKIVNCDVEEAITIILLLGKKY